MAPSRVVDHLGETLHRAAHDAAVAAAPAQQDARVQAERGMRDQFEQELRPLINAMLGDLHAGGELPAGVAALFDQAGDPEHAALLDVLTAIIIAFCFQVMGTLVPPLLQATANDQWSQHANLPLSPQQCASLVVRGWLAHDAASLEASNSGIDGPRFDLLVEGYGNPPGPQALGEAFRRGIIDQDRFGHGIRESDIKPEWLDVLTALVFSPPSAAEAVAAAVQGHLDLDTARLYYGQNGISPDTFDWVYETAGRPPGVQELIGLLRRGLVTEQVVRDAVRESNIKNKYTDAIIATRVHIPPMRTAISLVRKGVATPEQGTKWLLDLGFEPDVAAAMIKEASTDATETAKNLTAAAYLAAYRDGLAAEGETTAALVGIGYQPADAAFLVKTATFQRDHANSAAIVGVVRSRFIAHRIDANDARNDLAALNVDPGNVDTLLAAWQVARDDTVAELTQPQTSAMFKKGLIDETDYRARLTRLGYAPVDIDLLTAFNTATEPGVPV